MKPHHLRKVFFHRLVLHVASSPLRQVVALVELPAPPLRYRERPRMRVVRVLFQHEVLGIHPNPGCRHPQLPLAPVHQLGMQSVLCVSKRSPFCALLEQAFLQVITGCRDVLRLILLPLTDVGLSDSRLSCQDLLTRHAVNSPDSVRVVRLQLLQLRDHISPLYVRV